MSKQLMIYESGISILKQLVELRDCPFCGACAEFTPDEKRMSHVSRVGCSHCVAGFDVNSLIDGSHVLFFCVNLWNGMAHDSEGNEKLRAYYEIFDIIN